MIKKKIGRAIKPFASMGGTQYKNLPAASGGTDLSLVTTGDKHTWNNKVDKVAGKGLSTNDYSDSEKGKVTANAEAIEAMVNVTGAKNMWDIEGWLNKIGEQYTKSGNTYNVSFTGASHDNPCQFSDTDIPITLSVSELSITGTGTVTVITIYNSSDELVGTVTSDDHSVTCIGCKIRFGANNVGTISISSPMIRPAGTDPTYVPYAMTNRELTERVETVFNNLVKPERASVSVLEYAATLSEGIYFYTTTSNTTDNPANASFMYIIFSASTGRTILAIPIASRDMYMNSTANNGQTWSGWKAVSMA